MPRLRFTRAEAEAIRLASGFIAAQPGGRPGRCLHARPARDRPLGAGSKHPVRWSMAFVFDPPEKRWMGGEVFVDVDLETGAVAIRE